MKMECPKLSAFSLIEVTLALGIAAFALVVIFALLPVGLDSNQTAIQQTAAMNIATGILADLRATPPTATTSPRLGINLSASSTVYLDEKGGPFPAATSIAANSRYRMTVTMTPPSSGQRTATIGNIVTTWPAQASPANAAGSISVFIALDRN
jgi:uncharacterized protein (TIGR02598 family)